MRNRVSRVIAASPALVAVVWAAGCGSAPAATDGDNSAAEIATVELRDLDIRVEASGTVEPIRVVEVKSKASGEILRIYVESGMEVKRGTLLAEIDPRDVRNGLAQAEADLEVARARLATAEAQRKRAEELLKANTITEQEYEAAALDEANARAQLIKAETNLELARERMGDVTIRAPIDGTIIEESVEIGQIIASASQNISGGTTLFKMADLSQMQVRTLVDETDIGQVQPGQTARVTVEAYPGRVFVGEVLKIEPQAVVEQNVTMFPVLVLLTNEQRLLKPGMNAEVEIEVARRENVVTIPNTAVVGMRDVAAAGAALGLDEDEVREALQRNRAAGPQGGGGPGGPGAAGPNAAAAGRPAAEGSGVSAECASLREKLRGGGWNNLSESDRALLQRCRSQLGGGRGQGRMAGLGGGPAGGRSPDVRPGVVFVATPKGPEPRMVLLGVNDWDYTEVIRGVEPGEKVYLISVASLQQQQQEFENRIRQRAANPMFGGGPGGGGPGGGRGGSGNRGGAGGGQGR
ncbi:MAG TPA: efflux RND transporter periplasmic adaptor subunit [Longimicrobiales bacterium]